MPLPLGGRGWREAPGEGRRASPHPPLRGTFSRRAGEGGWVGYGTETVFVALDDPPALVAVSFTEYAPAAAYVCIGFCSVLNPPSPKAHDQLVGESSSATKTVTCSPLFVKSKFATGGEGTVTTSLLLFDPAALVAVSTTVYEPAV